MDYDTEDGNGLGGGVGVDGRVDGPECAGGEYEGIYDGRVFGEGEWPYAMAELSEAQMGRLVGGQGCFGFSALPGCCQLLEGHDYVFKIWNRTGPTTLLFAYSTTVFYTNYCMLTT